MKKIDWPDALRLHFRTQLEEKRLHAEQQSILWSSDAIHKMHTRLSMSSALAKLSSTLRMLSETSPAIVRSEDDVLYDTFAESSQLLLLPAVYLACMQCGAPCGQPHSSSGCARCHDTAYCSTACMRAAWPSHKLVCSGKPCGAIAEAAVLQFALHDTPWLEGVLGVIIDEFAGRNLVPSFFIERNDAGDVLELRIMSCATRANTAPPDADSPTPYPICVYTEHGSVPGGLFYAPWAERASLRELLVPLCALRFAMTAWPKVNDAGLLFIDVKARSLVFRSPVDIPVYHKNKLVSGPPADLYHRIPKSLCHDEKQGACASLLCGTCLQHCTHAAYACLTCRSDVVCSNNCRLVRECSPDYKCNSIPYGAYDAASGILDCLETSHWFANTLLGILCTALGIGSLCAITELPITGFYCVHMTQVAMAHENIVMPDYASTVVAVRFLEQSCFIRLTLRGDRKQCASLKRLCSLIQVAMPLLPAPKAYVVVDVENENADLMVLQDFRSVAKMLCGTQCICEQASSCDLPIATRVRLSKK